MNCKLKVIGTKTNKHVYYRDQKVIYAYIYFQSFCTLTTILKSRVSLYNSRCQGTLVAISNNALKHQYMKSKFSY